MKILVDKMPEKVEECNFEFEYKFSSYSKRICTFRNNDLDTRFGCPGVDKCPHFKELKESLKELLEDKEN